MKILPDDCSLRLAANRFQDAFRLAIDVGSTTSKLALVGAHNTIVQSIYRRHQADVTDTLLDELRELAGTTGDIEVYPVFTGSAGMGLAERTGIAFVQEVVAASRAVLLQHPQSRMLVDIGGEDCKMIFFDDRSRPDIRMNGSCAGGTGAFIDQMACLLDLSPEEFDKSASQGKHEHIIASRCGVFAKTDIQNLINTGVSKSDIARSVFRAVSCQVVSSLARGHRIQGPVVLIGGPLHFFQSLRTSLLDVLSIPEHEAVRPAESLLYPAFGAALSINGKDFKVLSLKQIISIIENTSQNHVLTVQHDPLFSSREEFETWRERKARYHVERTLPKEAAGMDLFLGVDAGSTTTKIVAIDERARIVFTYYAGNRGEPLESVKNGLMQMAQAFGSETVKIRRSVATGYGEELIKIAFEIDEGVVETIAHYRAAMKLEKDVSFILDIGGQDMKAIFIRNGIIHNIEVNEACSSGCGSFIETFADSLGHSAGQFGELACTAVNPVDLGSRCTVFMNSCVKQALRQGNSVADVAAGLAYSVVQNCLYKVLRISDKTALGNKIIVQGGTVKSPAVLRALEKLLGVEVIRPDIAEYMGAYGAAIIAREHSNSVQAGSDRSLRCKLESGQGTSEQQLSCKGCTNHCRVRTIQFSNDRRYYTGNRCERIFTNRQDGGQRGDNLFDYKIRRLESYPESSPERPVKTIGIPMVLNSYDNYPFWAAFFSELGWKVVRSSCKDSAIVKESVLTVMSDNICYPAKLAHSHILDLIRKKVDRIFYPRVVFEYSEFNNSANHYNCPIVTGYPDVIDSAVDPEGFGVPLDSPTINFNDEALLKAACVDYVSRFNIDKPAALAAYAKARHEMDLCKEDVQRAGLKTIEMARANKQQIIVLGSRPYHQDPAIHHGIPEMIAAMGIHVIPADALPLKHLDLPSLPQVADQWEYSNRLYRAAHWAGMEPLADFVHLNSFGCGPDAIVIDEIKSILETYSLSPVVLKIDEITSIGSAKLRIRSLLESKGTPFQIRSQSPRRNPPLFAKKDRHRTILVPDFSPFYSIFTQTAFTSMGYTIETLPPPDKESVRTGLKYLNNDICYPAVITIGDIIKALQSGTYDPGKIAVGLTETGGPCRATNYISILKKALLSAGYGNVPVISATTNKKSLNDQPGFVVNKPKLICLIFSSLMMVDQLVRMFHATAVRETIPGQSLALLRSHLDCARKRLGSWTIRDRTSLLERAIGDFNAISTFTGRYPKAGLVGEIYVKYNPFSNGNIVERLMRNGIQVVIPPLITFFLQNFINVPFNHDNNIERAGIIDRQLLRFYQHFIENKIVHVNRLMTRFKHTLDPVILPQMLSVQAKKVVNLCNQAGEGWLLPGEIAAMFESGIRNIICLQPFGCIANHVVGKGISSKLSNLYPELNLLNLDMDAGNSDANIQNRLDFFIHAARDQAHRYPDFSRV